VAYQNDADSRPPAACKDRRLLRAMQHVEGDLTLHPTAAELAQLVGLERAYFCKQFRKAVGLTFSGWNRQIRVDRAKHLLINSDMPISLVAAMIGYADVTTFERNFRRCANVTPRHFRQLQRLEKTNSTPNADKNTQNAETVFV
jgi:AraC-like DNA-binding protein